MKNRQGFVSNSSSSSFIVLMKGEALSIEELRAKSNQEYSERIGEEIVEGDYHDKKSQSYAEEGKYVLMISSVEWGGEESVKHIIPTLLKKLGHSTENISFDWDE